MTGPASYKFSLLVEVRAVSSILALLFLFWLIMLRQVDYPELDTQEWSLQSVNSSGSRVELSLELRNSGFRLEGDESEKIDFRGDVTGSIRSLSTADITLLDEFLRARIWLVYPSSSRLCADPPILKEPSLYGRASLGKWCALAFEFSLKHINETDWKAFTLEPGETQYVVSDVETVSRSGRAPFSKADVAELMRPSHVLLEIWGVYESRRETWTLFGREVGHRETRPDSWRSVPEKASCRFVVAGSERLLTPSQSGCP